MTVVAGGASSTKVAAATATAFTTWATAPLDTTMVARFLDKDQSGGFRSLSENDIPLVRSG